MIANIKFAEQKFTEFNRRMFAGRLPAIRFELSEAKTFLGQYEHKGNERLIKLSTFYDLQEAELEDIIIHEMIHYFIAYNGLKDTSSHGDIFRALMESINAAHNRRIAIRHKISEPLPQATNRTIRAKWHVIAAVYMHNGSCGLKVLPRVLPKIKYYRDSVLASPKVTRIDLFLSNNRFFERYPNSAALRVYNIDRKTLEENLKDAEPLKI